MSTVFPSQARLQRLRAYVRNVKTLHLFVNDITPDEQSMRAHFEEPTLAGYASVRLAAGGWRFEPRGDRLCAISTPALWRFQGGRAVVRGYFALDADGELAWSERFGEVDRGSNEWVDTPFHVLRQNDELELVVAIDQLPDAVTT